MSYVIPKASTNPYPKYHVGTPEQLACGSQTASGKLLEVDEPPQGYLPCRVCFKKNKSKTTKWKQVTPLTTSFTRDGVEFKNSDVPLNEISEISSSVVSLPKASGLIIVSRITPANKLWVFPSREAAKETMAYVKEVRQQSWSDDSNHKVYDSPEG